MARKKRESRPAVSLVIPVRGSDRMLQQTIDRANTAAINKVEIIVAANDYTGAAPVGSNVHVVNVDKPGTGHARHAGVLSARAPIVVTIDAHVRLCDMWDDYIKAVFERTAWRKSIACGHVGALKSDFTPAGPCKYHGAKIHWLEIKDTGEARPLAARWHDNKSERKIGAVMGAFYAFRRQWYSEIGEPWGVLDSWGLDEELISLASWMSGGDCKLLPAHIEAWHMFGRADQISYSVTEAEEIRNNRFKLLRLFPFPAAAVAEIERRFPRDMLAAQLTTDRQLSFVMRFAGCAPMMQEYCERWIEPEKVAIVKRESVETTPAAEVAVVAATNKPVALRPPQRLQERPIDVCDRCDAVGSFVCYSTERSVRRYRCKNCGRKAWRPRTGGRMRFAPYND